MNDERDLDNDLSSRVKTFILFIHNTFLTNVQNSEPNLRSISNYFDFFLRVPLNQIRRNLFIFTIKFELVSAKGIIRTDTRQNLLSPAVRSRG